MSKPRRTGLIRIVHAAGYSWQGFKFAWKNEAAFRQELTAAIILIPLALWLADTGVEAALLISALGIVVLAEIVNSAIEAVVDRFDEEHSLFGAAKDMGSAAVFVALTIVVTVWGLVLVY